MDIDNIKKISLNDNDVLVIFVPVDVFLRFRDKYAEIFRKFFPKNKIIICRNDTKLSVITKEAKDYLGNIDIN